MRKTIFTALLFAALLSSTASAQWPHGPLGPKSHPKWLEFIKPTKAELSYEDVGWRSAFWPAVEEARRLGRPILLWTMNGHPLGCT